MPSPKWKVHQFQSELSVVRIDNELGQRSYGWGGKDKAIIADLSDNHLCSRTVQQFIKKQHMYTAQILCLLLNKGNLRT